MERGPGSAARVHGGSVAARTRDAVAPCRCAARGRRGSPVIAGEDDGDEVNLVAGSAEHGPRCRGGMTAAKNGDSLSSMGG
jgi:hypothetical protein